MPLKISQQLLLNRFLYTSIDLEWRKQLSCRDNFYSTHLDQTHCLVKRQRLAIGSGLQLGTMATYTRCWACQDMYTSLLKGLSAQACPCLSSRHNIKSSLNLEGQHVQAIDALHRLQGRLTDDCRSLVHSLWS